MITTLKLTNFKSHKDTVLSLSNLTLLTGINGSGKSSVIQSLLLLRQSFLKTRLMFGIDLNNPLCQLGIGDDVLYKFSDSGIIKIEITNEEDVFSFSFDAGDNLDSSFLSKQQYSENITRDQLEKISLFNNGFQYVSTNRWGGKSSFPRDDFETIQQGQISLNLGQGELVAHFLHKNASKDTFNYLYDGKPYSLLEQVICWVEKISPNIIIEVQKDLGTTFNITYGYKGDDSHKSITNLRAENIGYGISYSLPIIVALVSAKPGDLLIIENPEGHLHPAGQAELIKLISRVAMNGIQVIVETHSDHIIRGVLVATKLHQNGAEGELSKEKVKIYYMRGKDPMHSSIIEEIKLSEGGVLSFQPKGFFDQDEIDYYYLNVMKG